MIEAVNSVVANAALLRGNADQGQQARLNNFASSNSERAQLTLAPYVSPYIQIDTNFNKAVLQLRDADTGDVVNQFPSETTMRARAAQAEISSQAQIADAIAPRNEGAPESAASFGRLSPYVRLETEIASGSTGSSTARVAESQIASAALSAGAIASSSAAQSSGVSVFA